MLTFPGLPQAKALEAQPEYQRVAPAYTWVMGDQPSSLAISHAVRESSLAVDMPYSSDLFSVRLRFGRHSCLTRFASLLICIAILQPT